MKIKKPLKKYFSQRSNVVRDFLKRPRLKYSAEEIHHLRVNLKKLRAVASLVDDKDKAKAFARSKQSIKRLFSSAGELREVQLRSSQIEKKHSQHLPAYLDYLNSRIYSLHKKFDAERKKAGKGISKQLGVIKTGLKHVRKKDIKGLEKTTDNKISKIQKNTQQATPQLHVIRKRIKKVQYIHEALNGDKRSVSAYKKFGEDLGNWHDCVVFAQEIDNDLKIADLPNNEIKFLNKISKELRTHAGKLQSEFTSGKLKGLS